MKDPDQAGHEKNMKLFDQNTITSHDACFSGAERLSDSLVGYISLNSL